MARRRGAAYRLALGGILSAIILVWLLLQRLLPTADLFFYLLMSLTMLAAVLSLGLRAAALVWLSTSLLAWPLVGPPASLAYALAAGPYPILKGLIERRRFAAPVSYLLKGLVALAILGVFYLLIDRLGLSAGLKALNIDLPLLALIALGLFFLYDLALSRALAPIALLLGRLTPRR